MPHAQAVQVRRGHGDAAPGAALLAPAPAEAISACPKLHRPFHLRSSFHKRLPSGTISDGKQDVNAAFTGCPGAQGVSGSLVWEQRGKVISKPLPDRDVTGEWEVRKGKFMGICCGVFHGHTQHKCAVLWIFQSCVVLSFICIHLIDTYILNNRQKLMAQPSYDPTGQLSSSCLKTLWNRSHKRVEQERRNVCKFPLATASLTQTAVHRAALASRDGHIQTRSRSTSKRNNTEKTFTSHQASAWGSTGQNYRAGIIRVTSHREEFPFFTSECYSSFQCPSLNMKDVKAMKVSH